MPSTMRAQRLCSTLGGRRCSFAPARSRASRHAVCSRRRISPNSSTPAATCTSAQHHQGAAPADQVAQQAAGRLAEHDAQDLPREEARQHRLAALVGHDVADPGNRHGDDGRRPGAGQEPHQHQRAEARHGGRASRVATPAHSEPSTTILSLPRASAERPDHDLEHAVGQRERHHDRGGRADADAELARDLRQQRIAHAQVGGAGKRGQRQDGDRPRRRLRRRRSMSSGSTGGLSGWLGRAEPPVATRRRGGCRGTRMAHRRAPCRPGRGALLADAALAVAAVAGEVEMEVVAVVGVVGGAQHRGEDAAGAAVHGAQEIALGQCAPPAAT